MQLLSRVEFTKLMESKFGKITNDHPLWCPESSAKQNQRSKIFIKCNPLRRSVTRNGGYEHYYSWCENNLQSIPLCYYSDHDNLEEWWGFSSPGVDITVWALKWA